MRTRFGLWLGVVLLVVPSMGGQDTASWRPRRLAAGTIEDGQPYTTKFGQLQSISNDHLLFLSGYKGGFYHFNVLGTNGQAKEFKVGWLHGGVRAQFIGGHKAIAWGTAGSDDGTGHRITAQILDCQRMRAVKGLQPGEAIFSNGAVTASRGQDRVLIVKAFSALEWDLRSGRLTHRWKLSQSEKDDPFVAETVYSPRTDSFVQMSGGRIRVWNAKTGRATRTAGRRLPHFKTDYTEGDPPSTAEFSPNADLIVYDEGYSGSLRVARCDKAQVLWMIPEEETVAFTRSIAESVRFSPDGRELYFYSAKRHRFTVFGARSGRVLRHLTAPPEVDQFWLSPDGTHLCSESGGSIWWQRAR